MKKQITKSDLLSTLDAFRQSVEDIPETAPIFRVKTKYSDYIQIAQGATCLELRIRKNVPNPYAVIA